MKRLWSTFLVFILFLVGFPPASQAAVQAGDPELVWDFGTETPDNFDYEVGFADSISKTSNETNSVVLGSRTFFIGPSTNGHNGLYSFTDALPTVTEVIGPDGPITNVSALRPLGTSKLVFKMAVGSHLSPAIYDVPTGGLVVFDQLRTNPFVSRSDIEAYGPNAVFFAAPLNSAVGSFYLISDTDTEPTLILEPGIANLEPTGMAMGSDGVYFATGQNSNIANFLPIDFANQTAGALQTLSVDSGELRFVQHAQLDLMLYFFRDASSNFVFGYVGPQSLTLVPFFDQGQISGSEGINTSGPRVMLSRRVNGQNFYQVHHLSFDRSNYDPTDAASFPTISEVYSGSPLGRFSRVLHADGTRVFFQAISGNSMTYWIQTLDGNTNPDTQLRYARSTAGVDGGAIFFFADRAGAVQIGQENPQGPGFEVLTQSGGDLDRKGIISALKTKGGISKLTGNDQTTMFRDSQNGIVWRLENSQLLPVTSGDIFASELISTPQGFWVLDYTASSQNIYRWRDGSLSLELSAADFAFQVDAIRTGGEEVFLARQDAPEIRLLQSGSSPNVLTGPWSAVPSSDWSDEYKSRPITGAAGLMEASAVIANSPFDAFIASATGGWVIEATDLPGCSYIGNAFFVADSYFVSCYDASNSELEIHRVELSDSDTQTTLALVATMPFPYPVSFNPMGVVADELIGHLLYTTDEASHDNQEIPTGIYAFDPLGSLTSAISLVPGSSTLEASQNFVFTNATAPIISDRLWFVGKVPGDDLSRSTASIYWVTGSQLQLVVAPFLTGSSAIGGALAYQNGYLYAEMNHPGHGEEIFRISITEPDDSQSQNNQNNDNEPTPEIVIVPSTPSTDAPPSAGGVTITESNIRPGGAITLSTSRQISQATIGSEQLFFKKTEAGYQILLPSTLNTSQTITLRLTTSTGPITISVEPRVQIRQLDNQVDSVIKRNGNTARVVLYDLVNSGKAQVFVNGKEVAWIRATSDSDPKLRTALHGRYMVRNIELAKGKNVIEIYQDGERLRRVSYTLASGKSQ